MNLYAEDKIDLEEKVRLNRALSTYMAGIMKELFREVDKKGRSREQDRKESQIMEQIVANETNLWACIYRTTELFRTSGTSEIRRPSMFIKRDSLERKAGDAFSPKLRESANQVKILDRRQTLLNEKRQKACHVLMKKSTLRVD